MSQTGQPEVIVGFDASTEAHEALRWAADEATRLGQGLRVVIVRPPEERRLEWPAGWTGVFAGETAEQARLLLKEWEPSLARVDVVDGSPAWVLIEASRSASVTVLGSRGHGRISGMMLGSVSQHVARHAEGPVVVVREPTDLRATRIVVGVDGSGGSIGALEFALDHASRVGVDVVAVHGWRAPARSGRDLLAADVGEDSRIVAAQIDEADRLLAETTAGYAEKYPDVVIRREAVPIPAARLLADASRTAALVVVGSRGRGAFREMLLGSVSQSVLEHATCPVAVVR